MNHDIVPIPSRDLDRAGLENLPTAIARAGEGAAWRFVEFFTANIRNRNTRAAYAQAVAQFFRWCEARGISGPRQDQAGGDCGIHRAARRLFPHREATPGGDSDAF